MNAIENPLSLESPPPTDAALMLTTICKQKEDTAGMAHRLMHEILLECSGEGNEALSELATVGGSRSPAA